MKLFIEGVKNFMSDLVSFLTALLLEVLKLTIGVHLCLELDDLRGCRLDSSLSGLSSPVELNNSLVEVGECSLSDLDLFLKLSLESLSALSILGLPQSGFVKAIFALVTLRLDEVKQLLLVKF